MKTGIYKVRFNLNPLLKVVTENPVRDVLPPTFTGGGGGDELPAAVFRKQDPMGMRWSIRTHFRINNKGTFTNIV